MQIYVFFTMQKKIKKIKLKFAEGELMSIIEQLLENVMIVFYEK